MESRMTDRAEPAGQETILLVEDEDSVRHLLRTVLRRDGYTVIEARCGTEALTISSQHAGTIDLLMTDLVMPDMNGNELAGRLATLRPDTRVIYMSGYTEQAVLNVLTDRATFLQKPFTPGAIARRVRAVLDAPPARAVA
jgi:two-component system, cell cycle sensor histidine kinase and response regulator CckA